MPVIVPPLSSARQVAINGAHLSLPFFVAKFASCAEIKYALRTFLVYLAPSRF
jgi:hypothetical protein